MSALIYTNEEVVLSANEVTLATVVEWLDTCRQRFGNDWQKITVYMGAGVLAARREREAV